MIDKTILVVNDERLINRAIVEQLKNRGFTNIMTAFNGRDALERMKEKIPDMIISDINMPYIDGWRLCAILKENRDYHKIPVILISATYGNWAAEQMAREVGASAFIQAPYNEVQLTSLVQNLLIGGDITPKAMEVLHKRKVLVADADSHISGKLGLYLTDEGNEVIFASDGEMALEIIEENKPDILFLAYHLPKMDSLEVVKKTREIYHPLIVMLVTPMEYSDFRKKWVVWEIDEYVKKPLKLGDIPGICDRIFRKYNIRKLDEQVKEKVSQLSASRGELNTILDNLTEMVVIVNQDDVIQYGNRVFKEFIGDKPITDSCYRIIYGREERCKDCQREMVIKEGKPKIFERILSDGRHLIITQSPIKMQDESVYCLEVTRDITDMIKIKEMLLHQERLALVGEVVSSIAHELNNALTGVIGYAGLLAEDNEIKSDRARKDIEKILKEAERCHHIAGNILSITRKRREDKRLLDINDVIEKTIGVRDHHLKMSNIGVVKEFEDAPQIMGDFFQLQQVFLNLINNAVYAMKEAHGKGRLTIRTKVTPLNSPFEKGGLRGILRIEFENDGPGIPEEIRQKIFEPFFTTKGEKGTGLGLNVSAMIIQEHGGRLWVESPCLEQRGARFIIEIPIYKKI
ncbi:MAG: response regulator [Nitrospinae bacterium]|nr:response regulator [Nitrospinota bacterium]